MLWHKRRVINRNRPSVHFFFVVRSIVSPRGNKEPHNPFFQTRFCCLVVCQLQQKRRTFHSFRDRCQLNLSRVISARGSSGSRPFLHQSVLTKKVSLPVARLVSHSGHVSPSSFFFFQNGDDRESFVFVAPLSQ